VTKLTSVLSQVQLLRHDIKLCVPSRNEATKEVCLQAAVEMDSYGADVTCHRRLSRSNREGSVANSDSHVQQRTLIKAEVKVVVYS